MHILTVLFRQHSFHRLVSRGERFFKKLPHLPYPLMEFLMGLLPGLFFALGILHAAIGALVMTTGAQKLGIVYFFATPVSPLYLMINGMLAVANGLLMLLSFPEIRRASAAGWQSLFIINMISILQSLMSILFAPLKVFSVILYIAVTLYITFEFKPYFKRES
jgi:hypothetical protein